MRMTTSAGRNSQAGFTLVETMVSSVLFLIGLVAVAQLVPATLRMNLLNRNDSSALTYAQRELAQMLAQPLTKTPPQFTDADGNICQLGNPAAPNTVVGSPLVSGSSVPMIDYTSAPVPGYSITSYVDPNDPSGTTYDIRWAVITVAQSGTVVSKRFILGAWRRGGNGFAPPVTIDSWVQK